MFDRLNRILFGGLIGWLAGYSFVTALLPFALQALAPEALGFALPGMAWLGMWSTVLWIPLGAGVAWLGNLRRSALLFGGGAVGCGPALCAAHRPRPTARARHQPRAGRPLWLGSRFAVRGRLWPRPPEWRRQCPVTAVAANN